MDRAINLESSRLYDKFHVIRYEKDISGYLIVHWYEYQEEFSNMEIVFTGRQEAAIKAFDRLVNPMFYEIKIEIFGFRLRIYRENSSLDEWCLKIDEEDHKWNVSLHIALIKANELAKSKAIKTIDERFTEFEWIRRKGKVRPVVVYWGKHKIM